MPDLRPPATHKMHFVLISLMTNGQPCLPEGYRNGGRWQFSRLAP